MLKINDRMELVISYGSSRGTYSTRVEEVEVDRFKVALPTVQGVPVALLTGDRITCLAYLSDGQYQFTTEVLGRQMSPLPVVIFALPTKMEKIQRRDYHRLGVNLPVRYNLVTSPEEGADSTPETKRSRLTNLSGGGCSIVLDEAMEAGTLLDLYITLSSGPETYATAEVVRVNGTTNNGFVTGCRFVRLEKRALNEIIHYIFREERERRKRGLS